MATYSVAGHQLLSEGAKALGPGTLEAYAEEAEALFGLSGTAITGQDLEDIRIALVRQINLSVLLAEQGGGAVTQESKGDQSKTFAKSRDGAAIQIDAVAQQIVDRVLARVGSAGGAVALPLATRITPLEFRW